MAGRAISGHGNVARRLGRGTDTSAVGMTTGTFDRRTDKHAVDVTTFAVGQSMRAVKLETGGEMIERRPRRHLRGHVARNTDRAQSNAQAGPLKSGAHVTRP